VTINSPLIKEDFSRQYEGPNDTPYLWMEQLESHLHEWESANNNKYKLPGFEALSPYDHKLVVGEVIHRVGQISLGGSFQGCQSEPTKQKSRLLCTNWSRKAATKKKVLSKKRARKGATQKKSKKARAIDNEEEKGGDISDSI